MWTHHDYSDYHLMQSQSKVGDFMGRQIAKGRRGVGSSLDKTGNFLADANKLWNRSTWNYLQNTHLTEASHSVDETLKIGYEVVAMNKHFDQIEDELYETTKLLKKTNAKLFARKKRLQKLKDNIQMIRAQKTSSSSV